MKILFGLVATAFLLSASNACSKKEKEAPPSPPAKEDATPPAAGARAPVLDIALLTAASDLPQTGAPFSEAQGAVEKRLGKVTTIHGAEYRWAARAGDRCAYLSVEMLPAESGAKVGVVQGPVAVTKGESEADWNRCLDSVGAKDMAVEDPKAPEPPEAGGLVTISDILAGVEGKPGTWVGAEVSLKGFYVSASTAFVEAVKTTTITISETEKNPRASIGCTFASGDTPALKAGDEVTVRGKVHASFGGGLEACQLQP